MADTGNTVCCKVGLMVFNFCLLPFSFPVENENDWSSRDWEDFPWANNEQKTELLECRNSFLDVSLTDSVA